MVTASQRNLSSPPPGDAEEIPTTLSASGTYLTLGGGRQVTAGGTSGFLEGWDRKAQGLTTRELKKKGNDHQTEAELKGLLAASGISTCSGVPKNEVSKGEEIVSKLLVRSMSFPDIDDPGILSLYIIVTQSLVC